ncbi:sensor histidine kinase [Variovorax rhizosphaerae]|uniref:histidine kinase n=1 Tax=Variovorax rhizosphaerae TaxID=1836200 RepID=A0ABU8WQ81_9BURK
MADDASPPPEDRSWADVRLPDNWSRSRRQTEGIGWYRIPLDLATGAPARLGILVPRLSMNGEIFVNGQRVLSGGRLTDPVTRNWNTPFFVEVPTALLRPGANVLDIRLFAYRNSNGGLGWVYWGEAGSLQARGASLYALHVKGAVLSFAVAVVAAFIGIATWVRMNREPIYGLFGLAMIAWAVRYTNYFVQDAPFNATAYAVLVHSAQGWFFIFFTPFLLRLSKLRWPTLEWTLLGMAIVGTGCIYAAFQGWMALGLVIGLWMCVWVPGSAVLLAISARNAYRSRTTSAVLAGIVAWVYVPLTVRDLLITSDLISFDSSYISHYVGVPLALLIAWMVIDRLVESAQAAAKSELARAHAASEERQRITQDMHDGLGLQLNAALRVVERGHSDRNTVTDLLRSCLDELRLIVDSSAAHAGEFLPLLASLRIHQQSRLERIGIHIRWQMEAFPADLVLPPGMKTQVLRIVQEAINNTIKHAGATLIEFRTISSPRPARIVFEVRDNGTGFRVDAGHAGHGLSGMHRRALAAGVELAIDSGAGGTTIRIDLPDLRAQPLQHDGSPAAR